jgi:hypothetical protein
MDPRGGLAAVEKRKTSWPYWELTLIPPSPSLQPNHYTGWATDQEHSINFKWKYDKIYLLQFMAQFVSHIFLLKKKIKL